MFIHMLVGIHLNAVCNPGFWRRDTILQRCNHSRLKMLGNQIRHIYDVEAYIRRLSVVWRSISWKVEKNAFHPVPMRGSCVNACPTESLGIWQRRMVKRFWLQRKAALRLRTFWWSYPQTSAWNWYRVRVDWNLKSAFFCETPHTTVEIFCRFSIQASILRLSFMARHTFPYTLSKL